MKYKNKEAEMEYKNLRSRFLGMIIGCAIGEIVGRESLVYIDPDDEAEEKNVSGVICFKPRGYRQGLRTRKNHGIAERGL